MNSGAFRPPAVIGHFQIAALVLLCHRDMPRYSASASCFEIVTRMFLNIGVRD